MKLNWGNALLLFFIGYIFILGRTVYKSTQIDHSLVVDNYYEHDIKYQEKYDKIKNRNLLEKDLNIYYDAKDRQLQFKFGKNAAVKKAEVQMYCPFDKGLDFTQELEIDEDFESNIKLGNIASGKWKVKVEWNDNARTYFKEQDIYIAGL